MSSTYVHLAASALRSEDKANFVVEQKEGEPWIFHGIETLKNDYKEDKVRSP